jgi:Zn-dependent alcohol dehydrogenase
MKCQAAVLTGVGKDWDVREIDLDPPREGEVLVKMAVAGICHSDEHMVTGDMVPAPDFTSRCRSFRRAEPADGVSRG